jgi:hypothetical protein
MERGCLQDSPEQRGSLRWCAKRNETSELRHYSRGSRLTLFDSHRATLERFYQGYVPFTRVRLPRAYSYKYSRAGPSIPTTILFLHLHCFTVSRNSDAPETTRPALSMYTLSFLATNYVRNLIEISIISFTFVMSSRIMIKNNPQSHTSKRVKWQPFPPIIYGHLG